MRGKQQTQLWLYLRAQSVRSAQVAVTAEFRRGWSVCDCESTIKMPITDFFRRPACRMDIVCTIELASVERSRSPRSYCARWLDCSSFRLLALEVAQAWRILELSGPPATSLIGRREDATWTRRLADEVEGMWVNREVRLRRKMLSKCDRAGKERSVCEGVVEWLKVGQG